MFRRLEKWFDCFSDGWNPIIVRDLRRLRRSLFFTVATIAHLGLLIFLHVADLQDTREPEFFEIVQRIFPTYAVMFVGILLAIGGDVRARLTDEFIDAVPRTPKERLHGGLGISLLKDSVIAVEWRQFSRCSGFAFVPLPQQKKYHEPFCRRCLVVVRFIAARLR